MIGRLMAGAGAGRNTVAQGSINTATLSHASSDTMAGSFGGMRRGSPSRAGLEDSKGAYIQPNSSGYGKGHISQSALDRRNYTGESRLPSSPANPRQVENPRVFDYTDKTRNKLSKPSKDESLSKLIR